jgi:hypothetical protein
LPSACSKRSLSPQTSNPVSFRCESSLPSASARRAQLLGRAPALQGELQLGLEDRKRRAQLVACVGDEGPLVLEGFAEAQEHRVQRLPQPGDLIVGRRHRQALVGLGTRDLRGPRSHRLHRAQSCPSDAVRGQRGEDERDRATDEQQLQ